MKSITVIQRLLGYVAAYKGKMALLVFVGLFGILFEVAKPFPVKIVIDHVLTGKPLPEWVLAMTGNQLLLQDRYGLLAVCVVLMAIITIGSAILGYYSMSLTVSLAQRLVFNLSVDFYKKIQQLSLTFFNRNKTGDLLQRISGDVFVVYFLVAQILIPIITSCFALCVMFYVMSRIDMGLAFIALSVIPLLGVLLALFNKPMTDSSLAQNNKLGDLSAFVQQSLSSIKIIQAFGREEFMNQKVKHYAQEYGNAFLRSTMVSTGFNQWVAVVTGIATAILIGIGAYRGIEGNLSAGDLYLFIGYVAGMLSPATSLFTAIGTSVVIGSRGKRVFEIMDSDETVTETNNPASMQTPVKSIHFESVSFGYKHPDGYRRPILDDISFTIQAGKTIAIVGATGAGKTSLISLITRFFDPDAGRILINGEDIRNFSLADVREQISIVMQEPFLFPMTIRENIAFGKPNASMDEIQEAAKAAFAHDFIMKMPEQYESVISESGSMLSGGEKQRISLARCFLKKAPIWILDEPTSALDAQTEANIFKSLVENTSGRIIFLISHRISAIKHADQIITLQDGHIAEAGTHENLLKNGLVYANLYKYHHVN